MKDRSRNTRRAGARPLVAWSVSDGESDESGCWALVYARTEHEAQRLAAPLVCELSYRSREWEPHPSELAVSRAPGADRFADEDERVEHRTLVQRLAGWRCEGDSCCESCDLATMDDDFPLCDECSSCEGCGHSDDCPTRPVAERLAAARRRAADYQADPENHAEGCTSEKRCWRCQSWTDEITDLERESAESTTT